MGLAPMPAAALASSAVLLLGGVGSGWSFGCFDPSEGVPSETVGTWGFGGWGNPFLDSSTWPLLDEAVARGPPVLTVLVPTLAVRLIEMPKPLFDARYGT
jgi:hypothetical protein